MRENLKSKLSYKTVHASICHVTLVVLFYLSLLIIEHFVY